MVDGPALQLDVPIVLETYLAMDHVCLTVIAGVGIAKAAIRAYIVPEQDVRLFCSGGHTSSLDGCATTRWIEAL